MRGNAVFADAFNYLLYDGRAVIDPHNLKEIDPTSITCSMMEGQSLTRTI